MRFQLTLDGRRIDPEIRVSSKCGHRADPVVREACSTLTPRTHTAFRRVFTVHLSGRTFTVDCSDGHDRCPCCGMDNCDEPAIKDRNATYEEPGFCILCVMEIDGSSIEEIAAVFW